MPGQFDANGFIPTEVTGTLSNSSATLAANPNRRGVIACNPSDTVMTLRIGGTADANTGIPVPAGTAISFRDGYVPTALLSLFCAGASKPYVIYHW